MQSISEINKIVLSVKKVIKLNSKIFYHNNINYFPLVKLEIYKNKKLKKNRSSEIKKSTIFLKSKYLFIIPIILIRKIFYNSYIKKKLVKSDVVFFSDNNFYYNEHNNKKFNAFIDPYFNLISKKYNSIKLEVAPHWFKDKKKKLIQPIYLKFLYLDLIKFIKFKINNYFFFQEQKFYINLKQLLRRHKIDLDANNFQKRYEQIYFNSEIIEKILKKINPRVVFLTCFYNDMSLAIILACKRLQIKTVDIQHGGFEPKHVMYRYWQKSEFDKGYEFLPDFFWVWGKGQLRDKFFKQNKNHRIVEGGKLLIQSIEKEIKNSEKKLSNEDKNFLKSLKKYNKKILFCATSNYIPRCVINAIKQSQKNKKWLWMIRLHPRHSNYKIFTEELLKEKISIQNVKILQPSKLNLHLMIKKSSHILFDQSSVAIDASYQKKPVICLTNKKDLFKSWDDLNICEFTESASKINDIIKNQKKNKCTKIISYKVINYRNLQKLILS